MSPITKLYTGCLTALVSWSCAGSGPNPSGSVPDLSGPPPGMAPRLEVDTAVVGRPAGETASTAAGTLGCASGLRDPRSGSRFVLAEVLQAETRAHGGASGTVFAVRAEGNYEPAPGDSYRLPPERYLRVVCGTYDVLGFARSIQRRR